jgi:hypothetical protein
MGTKATTETITGFQIVGCKRCLTGEIPGPLNRGARNVPAMIATSTGEDMRKTVMKLHGTLISPGRQATGEIKE